MNEDSFKIDDIQSNETFGMDTNKDFVEDGEYDLEDLGHSQKENNELFERKCDIIEKAIEEAGLHRSKDDEDEPYSTRGFYYLDERIVITVDKTKTCTVRLQLDLYGKCWEDDDFDFDGFFDIVSKRCFVSLQKVDDEWIEFRSLLPDLPIETFPVVMRAALDSAHGTVRYFDRLVDAYHELYC